MDTTFLFIDWLIQPLWMWLSFLAIVIVRLAFDFGVLQRHKREIGARGGLFLSIGNICLGLAFAGWIWWQLGSEFPASISPSVTMAIIAIGVFFSMWRTRKPEVTA